MRCQILSVIWMKTDFNISIKKIEDEQKCLLSKYCVSCIHFYVVQRQHRVFFDSPYLVCRTLEQAWLKCVCNIHSLPLFWTLRLCTMCQFPWQIARNCRFHFEVLSRCQKRHLINKLDSIAQSRRKKLRLFQSFLHHI